MAYRIDWNAGRTMFEQGGKSFTEIGQALGCRRQTVAARAAREAWVSPSQVLKETAPQRREEIARRFIERDSEAILERLAKMARATEAGLEVAAIHIERLRDESLILCKQRGEVTIAESPSLELRRLASALASLHAVTSDLASLRDNTWRTSDPAAHAETDREREAIQRALADLERVDTDAERGERIRAALDELRRHSRPGKNDPDAAAVDAALAEADEIEEDERERLRAEVRAEIEREMKGKS